MFKKFAVGLLAALVLLIPMGVALAAPGTATTSPMVTATPTATAKAAAATGVAASATPAASAGTVQQAAATAPANTADSFNFNCKAALLLDADTGTVLYEKNADEKLPVASVTKVMTLLLAFEALDQGKFALDDQIVVSSNAAGMGGSQALLDANGKYKAGDLLKTIIVASANDSSVAMAELISGSESLFVEAMNARAAELGMVNTHFVNCTGLPAEGQYTTARDVALMSRQLIKHPLFFQYSKVWMFDLQHANGRITQLSNTNKLTRFYDGCDGIKTGSTDEAGYCLSSSAKRGDTRFQAVVLGANTSQERNTYVTKLFDYAFATYKSVALYAAGDVVQSGIRVWGGQLTTMNAVTNERVSALVKKGEEGKVDKNIEIYQPVNAPVEKGEQIGILRVYKDGQLVDEYPLLADRDVLEAGFWTNITKILDTLK